MSKRIGFDIDGVLADFNTAFIQRVIKVTGQDFFPPRPFDIPTWDYPQFYGYLPAQVDEVWQDITADESFWLKLPAYPEANEALRRLTQETLVGNDVYFITSRPGAVAKWQTEAWLSAHGFDETPTVLISSAKGLCARALKLDLYIDDRWENALDVAVTTGSGCRTCLVDRPWNQDHQDHEAHGIARVLSALSVF